MLTVKSDLSDSVHAHTDGQLTRGPDVIFDPLFLASDAYKLWVQVQRKGKVVTVPFVVVVA